MQDDLDAAYPGLNIDIVGVNASGHESANSLMTSGRSRPWLQDVDLNANGLSDLWDDSWDIEYRDVVILDGENVQVGVYNLTVNSLGVAANYATLRELMVDAAMKVQKPWHNRTKPVDVTGDGLVVPLDALFIINSLTSDGPRELPPPTTATFVAPFYDTDGDNFIAPIDALLVINHLNSVGAGGGESPVALSVDLSVGSSAANSLESPVIPVNPANVDWSLFDTSSAGVVSRRADLLAPTLAALTDSADAEILASNVENEDTAERHFMPDRSDADLASGESTLASDWSDLDDVLTCIAHDVAAR